MEKQFVDGMFYKNPNDKVKDFVKANISFNVPKFVEWLQKQQDERGWVNVDVKISKAGSFYCELNTWKPKKDISTTL